MYLTAFTPRAHPTVKNHRLQRFGVISRKFSGCSVCTTM